MKELLNEIKSEIKNTCPAALDNKYVYYNEDWFSHFIDIAGSVPKELKEFWQYCDFEIWLNGDIYKQLNAEDYQSHFSFMTTERACLVWQQLSKDSNREEINRNFLAGNSESLINRGFEEQIIHKTFFADFWFPFAEDANGSYLCIDTLPANNGNAGQLIYLLYGGENAYGPYFSKFSSLEDLLRKYLNSLKNGNYILEDDIIFEL